MTDSARPLIALGSDHAGYPLKARLIEALRTAGYTLHDCGTYGLEPVDYPDYARSVAELVAAGGARFGVLVCGTGIGVSIAANRNPKIRCALVHDTTTARLGREHNDANVVAFGARTISEETALDALRVFLDTDFAGGRHTSRVAKLGRVAKSGCLSVRSQERSS